MQNNSSNIITWDNSAIIVYNVTVDSQLVESTFTTIGGEVFLTFPIFLQSSEILIGTWKQPSMIFIDYYGKCHFC